jgi:hypothetical protein
MIPAAQLTIPDAVPEICSFTREHRNGTRTHADRHENQEEPEDTVSLLLLVYHTAALYVDTQLKMTH